MKIDNKTFYKWWVQMGAVMLASIFLFKLDLFSALWNSDQTKISFLIIGIYIIGSLVIGWLSKNAFNKQLYDDYGEYLWFSASAMINLGLIGTVAGFLIMLGTAFQEIDVSNIAKMQAVIADMAIGMSTALTTTLTGLICALLTKLQLIILEKGYVNEK